MYLRKKRNRSGSISVVVVEKTKGLYKEIYTVAICTDIKEIDNLISQGKEWIEKEKLRRNPEFDFEESKLKSREADLKRVKQFISQIDNIIINGAPLILDRVFDIVGFNEINDNIFRHLVLSRLSFPASKAATIEYLKNYYDEDLELHRIYRYLDKLNYTLQEQIQDISVKHTMKLFGGNLGVVFYDVTTLYFESDYEDDFRKTGFSKEGKHSNPQIILGLLVSLDGYPLAYTIHEGNKYEGHTMLPVITDFVKRYDLDDFIIVADSGLMTTANIEELENLGYKYIIGARIKSMNKQTKECILSHIKINKDMLELNYDNGRRLLVGYTDRRAKKDAYNRQKGIKRLEKAYKRGQFTKANLNKKGYNKFLEMKDKIDVTINYEKVAEDALWDGLKGYLTNTTIPTEQVCTAYHNLWNVERAFRIAKSKIEVRPMFHFTKNRIEAHICICFVALKIYKELERLLKQTNIGLSVDKVLNMAKTVTTIKIKLPDSEELISKTMVMQRHKIIERLFDDDFWVAQNLPDNQPLK